MKYPIPILILLCLLAGFALFASDAQAAPDDPTIVGGNPVPDPNPYVWQISLQEDGSHICGGSVIADRWILTAAHCVVQSLPNDQVADLCNTDNLAYLQEKVKIIAGVRTLSAAATENVFGVARCIAHPDYNPTTFANDIAVIELATSIPNAAEYSVQLMQPGYEADLASPDTWATVTGWGNMVPDNSQSSPDVLMALDLPLVAQQSCRKAWATVGVPILDSMVCAGFVAGGKSSCQGDSGGALVVDAGFGNYLQEGIVSFGPGTCAEPSRVPVYTRVSAFVDWLEQNTGEDLTTFRAPDLVVEKLEITANNTIGVVIRNQGTARVALDQGFWVDLYIDPQRPPSQVNETWNFVGNFGGVWGVDAPGFVLLPGESVALELEDGVYWPTLSHLPVVQEGGKPVLDIGPDTPLYVQVDSANAHSADGAILESHEALGEAYNNIAGPFFLPAQNVTLTSSALPYRVYLPTVTTGPTGAQVQSMQPAPLSAHHLMIQLPMRPITQSEE